MGRWLDAADSLSPSRRSTCQFRAFLDGLPPDERAEMDTVLKRAEAIAPGQGRYSYLHDVIVKGGGPDIDPQAISRHLRGQDKCRAS